MVTMKVWIFPLLVTYKANGTLLRGERKRRKNEKFRTIQQRTRWFFHSTVVVPQEEEKANIFGLDADDKNLMIQFEQRIEESMSIVTMSPTTPGVAPPSTRMSSFPTQMPSESGTAPSLPPTSPNRTQTVQPSESPSSMPSEDLVVGPPVALPTSQPTISGTTQRPNIFSPSDEPTSSPTITPTSSPTVSCNMSPDNRAERMLSLINVISRPGDISSPGSPQSLASNWIINNDEAKLCPQDQSWIQRYVVAVLYFSTNGDRWFKCKAPAAAGLSVTDANVACNATLGGGSSAWLTPDSECNWAGITCNEDDNVIQKLTMESNGVSGTLPFELRSLQSLVRLSLERGIITGTIPPDIGLIRTLEVLDLDNNLLEGAIPQSLYRLKNLKELDLDFNEFSGTINKSIGELTNLRLLQINNNNFSGTIPTELGQLSMLQVATFERNQLSGSMPDEVCSTVVAGEILGTLTTDCLGAPNRLSPPFLSCSCCSGCF